MLIKQAIIYTPKKEQRTLYIYLPIGYDNSEERYPVTYLFDGHNMFLDSDATYGTSWKLKDFLDCFEKPMICVGFSCSTKGTERLSEYSPYTFENDYWGYVPGSGIETLEWILKEVKPMIDKNYRTIPFRECTSIGGSSMGGLMAVYAGAVYNRWFSKLICISSSIDFNTHELMQDVKEAAILPDTRFFLSWGSDESGGGEDYSEAGMRKRNTALSELLKDKGADTRLYCQEGGRHCEADWGRQLPALMNYLWMQ